MIGRVNATGSPQVPHAYPASIPALQPGEGLGSGGAAAVAYRITGVIGCGGSGRVYRAQALADGRDLALKLPRTWECTEDLFHEARYAGGPDLPHLATIRRVDHAWRAGLGLDLPFLVMDAYRSSLYQRLLAGVPPRAQAVRWIREAALALQASGLVHRDLKPENLLLDEHDRLHVSDFGIAIPVNPFVRSRAGIAIMGVVGTAIYLSPEQIYEADDIDQRADIYALGLVLAELLTGVPAQPRFTGSRDQGHYLERLLKHEVDWRALPDPALAEVVRHCTAKARRERYPDYWALLADLDAYGEA